MLLQPSKVISKDNSHIPSEGSGCFFSRLWIESWWVWTWLSHPLPSAIPFWDSQLLSYSFMKSFLFWLICLPPLLAHPKQYSPRKCPICSLSPKASSDSQHSYPLPYAPPPPEWPRTDYTQLALQSWALEFCCCSRAVENWNHFLLSWAPGSLGSIIINQSAPSNFFPLGWQNHYHGFPLSSVGLCTAHLPQFSWIFSTQYHSVGKFYIFIPELQNLSLIGHLLFLTSTQIRGGDPLREVSQRHSCPSA